MKRYFLVLILLLSFVPLSFAQDARPIVRLIYYLPSDRTPQPDIDEKMDRLIKGVQQFYADQMEAHGFGRKTFLFETDADGKAVVHRVIGQFTDAQYRSSNTGDLLNEIDERFDRSRNYYLTAVDISTERIPRGDGSEVLGVGVPWGSAAGGALIPAFRDHIDITLAAHELGHAFGLQHDFRFVGNWVRTSDVRDPMTTSFCAAEWLDVHRAFNPTQRTANVRTKIEMFPPSLAVPPNAIRLRFKVTDSDGLYQAQLLTPTLAGWAKGFDELISCKVLNGSTDTTVEFVTTDLAPKNKSVSLQVIDMNGNFSWSQRYPIDVLSLLPDSKIVSIPDLHLAAAVRQEIGNITTHTMLNLTRLDVQNLGITDLTGLEQAYNLRSLNLGNNSITDVAPLTGLTQLKELNLYNNSITDAAPLTKLTQLEVLSLSSNGIVDVAPLGGLTQLQWLYLDNNSITDVAPLGGLTQLQWLYLDNNSIPDVAPLSTLTQLKELNLYNNSITDVAPLSTLTQLETLSLSKNSITDVAPLAGLTQLQWLNLYENSIVDVSPLSTLTQLETLWLFNNSIVDVSPLSGLTQLETLWLSHNSIVDVSPLSTLTQLERLYLANNSITNVRPLTGLTHLEWLYLDKNSIVDVSPLSTLTQLETLWLWGNSITDVAPLAGLTQLTHLRLHNNNISDIAPLAGLTQLETLWLGANSIVDVAPLAGLNLTGTEWDKTGLDVRGNPLSYVSINTHIPVMQAKDIEVKFSNRTPTTLVKISGDVQEGFVNAALPLPFVVEVRDQDNKVFAGVPVTFAITNGSGELNTTTTSTDTNGRVQAQLTFGQTAGKTTIKITAPKISKSVMFTATGSGPRTVVAFPDANLRAKIAEVLGKQPGETLTVEDLLTLTELTANDASLQDLTGLQSAGNLTILSLNNNDISDISLLGALTQLTTLSLDNNNLQDLTGLQFARNLTTLSLNNNDISDISLLGTLTQLTTLSLDNNKLSDIIPIIELLELKTLHLRGNLLDYSSLRTYIPALEASGTTISVTPRTPTSITKTLGTQGTAAAPLRVSVEVRDEQGLGFAGVPVSFTVTDGGGSLSSSNVVTDGTGAAGTTFTLGTTPGKNILSVSAAEIPQPISFTITAIDANTPVTIPDANLRAKIVETLGKPHGAELTAGDMLTLRQFQAPDANIRDLTGLEYAYNLKTLHLHGNDITDVVLLTGLTQLEQLYLYNNSIIDVVPLATLTKLKSLNLENTSIIDVAPLTGLTQLEQLYLYNNSIIDIVPLATLTKLKSLGLSGNGITDVTPLTELTQLETLLLEYNSIVDIAPLTTLTKLKSLGLSGNGIADVTPLTELTQLVSLSLGGNSIVDVTPLTELTQLVRLILGSNSITDVAPLAGLTQLSYLQLHYNNISDIGPLVGLNLTGTEWNKTGLDVRGNPLSYVSINTHIPAMQAKGIVVKFDNVAHPTLLKISGDEQEDVAGKTLASPFIVEIQDERGQPIQGVAVTFSIDAGAGELNPTTTKTDADGKAQTTLTLGWTPGTSIIRATATGIKVYGQFTATATALPDRLAADVNGDGVVDVADLVLVASDFGAEPVPGALPDTDVNDDGKINSEDVILVLEVLEGTAAAPSLDTQRTAAGLQQWIAEAKQRNIGDATFQRGITVLERLLATLLPKETALLANYPNPFNPETWVPYQLAKPAEVTLMIYATNGTVVRTLALGHQVAGHYQSRVRAAYWNGRNAQGEKVASGVYFYTLTAGDFTATRKMLIRK